MHRPTRESPCYGVKRNCCRDWQTVLGPALKAGKLARASGVQEVPGAAGAAQAVRAAQEARVALRQARTRSGECEG